MKLSHLLRFILVFFSLNFLLSCQKPSDVQQVTWSKQSGLEAPAHLLQLVKEAHPVMIRASDEVVEHSPQMLGPAEVDGSHLSKISDSSGETIFVKAHFSGVNKKSAEAHAQKLFVKRYQILELMKKKHLPLKKAHQIFDPKLLITNLNSKPRFIWQIDYVDKKQESVFSIRASEVGSIERITRVEHCFSDAKSLVFPLGPKLSDLKEELLSNLVGDGSLKSTRIQMTSADGQRVQSPDGQFIFEPNDDRFDHVQAFYFVQKTLDYAEKRWGFLLPFPLKIEMRSGYPQKANKMAYYNQQVFLGEGDGVNYKKIPRDPSIVSHEVAHALIDALSGMKTDEDAGAISEGFADFLSASVWSNPHLGHTAFTGGPYKRTVDNEKKVSEKNGGRYNDGLILAGTFWEIRKSLGPIKSQHLALKTISRLGAMPTFSDVRPAIIDAMKATGFSTEDAATVNEVLSKRGW